MNNKNLTTFYIIRHGETDWNVERKIQGHTDIPLNANGELQAQSLAKELQKISFDLVFSSDLLRAKRTAEIIALERKVEVQTTRLLRERNFGNMEGEPSRLFRDYDELLKELSHEQRFTHKLADNIENDEALISRILTFVRETAVTHPNKTILMVTHGGVIRTLLIHLGAYKYNDTFHIGNGAYVKITADGTDFFVKQTKGIER